MPLPLELDLPATDRLDYESEHPPGGESSPSPDAAALAAEMVEGPADRDDGPDLDVYERHGEPQRAEDEPAARPADHEPSESERKIRIILARDVEDASCGFKGLKGQEFDGVVSSEGDVYIDTEQGTVGLEAEEFEEVRQEEAPADANAPADDAPASKPAATAIQEAAKPKPKPKSLSSSGYTVTVVALAAHQRQVADVSAEIASAAVHWATLQEQTKAAKKEFDEKVEELRNLVARGPEAMPLFDRADDAAPAAQTSLEPREDSTLADTTAEAAPEQSASTGPNEPVSEEESYERLLDATPLSSLTLIKDGKKASLKGSLQKLADAGVNSIWDWERLRADVAAGKATYPPRIRKDDMEEAVSQWVATNWTGRRVEIQAGKGGPAAGAPQADPDPIFPDLTEAHDLALREFQPLALGLLKPAHDRITASGISNLTELADAIWDRDNPEDSGKPCWEKWTPDQDEYQTVRRAFCRWCADNLESAVQAGQTGQQTDQPASEATTAPTTAPAAEPTLDDI